MKGFLRRLIGGLALALSLHSAALAPLGGSSPFPLTPSSSGHYFVSPNGQPFFILHDAGWLAANQLSTTQMDTYLRDRKAHGFNAVIYQFTSQDSSTQSPSYQNQAGLNPWSTMNATGTPVVATAIDFSTPVTGYWDTAEHFIQQAQALDMLVIGFPAYVGFPSTVEGVYTAVMADSPAHLQSFGAFLANRFGKYPNIIWGMSGDNTLSQADLDQDWNIVLGMRSVRKDQLIYVKAQRNVSGAALIATNGGASRYPGFNVNNAYISNGSSGNYTAAADVATCIAATPAMPCFVDEGDYEVIVTDSDVRFALWESALSGAAGVEFGNECLYAFGANNNSPCPAVGPAAALTTYMDTVGASAVGVFSNWFRQTYKWWTLVPETGTTLVTTSLGSAGGLIVAALGDSGKFAMEYTPSSNFTLNCAALAGTFKAFWVDPSNGAVTPASGSPFANTGTHAFTTPGTNADGGTDWVLIEDAE